MNLQCRVDLGRAYNSGSQIARVLGEDWCGRELYCPACDSKRLSSSDANTPAIDFVCPECQQCFQLKSLKTWNQKKIVDAGYDSMLRAIRSDRVPNLLILQYSGAWLVKNLLLVPSVFFSETIIEKRVPLGFQARRAGWVGCNILEPEYRRMGKSPSFQMAQSSRSTRFEKSSLVSENWRRCRQGLGAGRSTSLPPYAS